MSTGDESPPGQSLRDWAEADATCCWGGTRPSTIVAMTPGVVSAESGATEAMGARILPHESASIRAMAADFEARGGDSRVEMAAPPAVFFAAATLAGWVALTEMLRGAAPPLRAMDFGGMTNRRIGEGTRQGRVPLVPTSSKK